MGIAIKNICDYSKPYIQAQISKLQESYNPIIFKD